MTREALLLVERLRERPFPMLNFDRDARQAADLIESLIAPPSEDAVKRVARALCSVTRLNPDSLGVDGNPRWKGWVQYAVPAIAAFPRSPVDGRQPSPVVCRHEAYQGRCAHCGVPMVGGRPVPPNHSPVDGEVERLRSALELAHREMAVAIAFCRRGPRPAKIGDPAPAENWAEMCSEMATMLALADDKARAALTTENP